MSSFKNYKAAGVTTETVLVTGPVDTQITVIGMTVANVSGITTKISVKLGTTYLLKDAIVTSGSALVPIGGEQKVVVGPGDTVSVTADQSVDVVLSVLEIS